MTIGELVDLLRSHVGTWSTSVVFVSEAGELELSSASRDGDRLVIELVPILE